MQLVVYLAILIATVFSVALEWNALVEPSAATRHEMREVSHLRVPPPPPPEIEAVVPAPAVTPKAAAVASPAVGIKSSTPAQQSAAVEASADQPAVTGQSPTPEPESVAAQPAPPQCDVTACAAAYGSFRASDCTWQPYDGPRRSCTKGDVASAEATSANADAGPVPPHCHVRICAEHYSSFNPTDCTYQPFDGPRRLCEK
jgi:hypothetical protein